MDSKEERKKRLAVQSQEGNRASLFELWESVRPVLSLKAYSFYLRCGADTCARHGVTLDDLQQESYFAFLDAVNAYKKDKGYHFTTYLNFSTKNRFRACMGSNALDRAESLNAPAGQDGESGDLLPDPKAAADLEAVDEEAERSYFHALLERGLKRLPPVREAVLRRRYYDGQTCLKVAEALHITPQDVRREGAKGLQDLRRDERIWGIREEYISGNACRGVGFSAWEWKGSVEERLVERLGEL